MIECMNGIIIPRGNRPSKGARAWPNAAARCQAVLCLAPFVRLVSSASAGGTCRVLPARSVTQGSRSHHRRTATWHLQSSSCEICHGLLSQRFFEYRLGRLVGISRSVLLCGLLLPHDTSGITRQLGRSALSRQFPAPMARLDRSSLTLQGWSQFDVEPAGVWEQRTIMVMRHACAGYSGHPFGKEAHEKGMYATSPSLLCVQ
jgi:hypothetical protein